MILIGQYDSPFVRRVAIALRLYDLSYQHLPWSTFGDADRLAAHNPLRRVPTLILDDGETLIDSVAILDHLDDIAGPERALMPASGAARRAQLRITALATGLCDKMVSLVYEQVLHDRPSEVWMSRCAAQITGVLDALEAQRAACMQPFWAGTALGHADIAVGCALRFLSEAHPALHAPGRHPHLAAHAANCEAMEVFEAVVQTFDPPRRK
ncbi:glutathione S-transferase family protein [Roseococcus sp. SYP-B2431]|uniref:glutathione S-transferase family protein n=1 Tax=Roseococcus sp. SYP-B2431 TaxID=2496640 RepID=UPI00103E0152|nr:glutathione S-transferase family protein [Roseococcus sp. SYP-B2431]TCH98354.1 glutathione S-transferase family protein [Roseococcus sp. SYP-B2431]